ncbi:MAG: 5-formyltetrahydrofolate cyclo-ligase, partial [Metallosphaera sp.]
PSEPFDVPVDIIATESSLIKTDGLEKPKGLILEYLTREKVNDTPYLMEYLRRTNRLHLIT